MSSGPYGFRSAAYGSGRHPLRFAVRSGDALVYPSVMVTLESSSAEETERIAALLAERLSAGDVVLVAGELGAGKTTFVRGACRALGVTGPVTSPTFTIGHVYAGRTRVSHLDLYRFQSLTDGDWGDLEPYFDGAIVFVEWPEAGAGRLPAASADVRLEHAGRDRRRIAIASSAGGLDLDFFANAHAGV